MSQHHIPVLQAEILAALVPEGRTVERVIDGTLGAGGHTRSLLDAGVETVLGLDLDPTALAIAGDALQPHGDRARLAHSSYADMIETARQIGWESVDGILLDLGVSSMQLDIAERGFAFMQDGPLDMRFDPTGDRPTAAQIINHWGQAELADIFYKYGEERHSRKIAREIVKDRPFERTGELAAFIERVMPERHKLRIHPATRVFQALRIAVNDELETVARVLPEAISLLKPGGRLVVMSFHSLEDRIVKRTFKDASTEIASPPGMMLEEKAATVRLITRKPIMADDAEIERNPRSRSAKLRVVEKI